ncbi:hypothetical protein PVK06_026742 [Gossypium arboreum]|uniref:Uncharacterized protein n=1 Tax=Gossypium arboreum TaxID=29729 RepID=A0ABR0NYH7_GOSAR|nr:hypothetical protein PVK06_026742 [Gossypium arboreum]
MVFASSQLSPAALPEFLLFPPIIRYYKPPSEEDDFRDRDRSVKFPPIVHVSNVEKEEDSRDVEECMRRIDSLVTPSTQEVADDVGAMPKTEERSKDCVKPKKKKRKCSKDKKFKKEEKKRRKKKHRAATLMAEEI